MMRIDHIYLFKANLMSPKIILLFFLMIILTACSPDLVGQPGQIMTNPDPAVVAGFDDESREAEARSALMDFFDALNQRVFEQAVRMYGGSYEVLQGYNPEIDPMNHVALLEAGCTFNGLMCLRVLDTRLIQADEAGDFVYTVTFANPDGSQFVLGPCCGATEEDMPPVNVFDVHVTCEQEGLCLVLDLPPFVP